MVLKTKLIQMIGAVVVGISGAVVVVVGVVVGEAEHECGRGSRRRSDARDFVISFRLQVHFLILLILLLNSSSIALHSVGHVLLLLRQEMMLLLLLLLLWKLLRVLRGLSFEVLFPPFDAPVLEPDLDLRFAEIQ